MFLTTYLSTYPLCKTYFTSKYSPTVHIPSRGSNFFFWTFYDHHLSPYLPYPCFLQWLVTVTIYLLIQEVIIVTVHYHTNACKTGNTFMAIMHTKMSKFFHQTFLDVIHTYIYNILAFGDNRFTGWSFSVHENILSTHAWNSHKCNIDAWDGCKFDKTHDNSPKTPLKVVL